LVETLLHLVRDTPRTSAAEPDGTVTHVDFGGARVLVADDNAINQEIALSMLESMGCAVTLAADGRTALALWRAEAFDLLLLDCQMPELDGYAVARTIRAAEAMTDIHLPIVALTANALAEDRAHCLAAGMDEHLAKPYRPADLCALLRRWLRTSDESGSNAASASSKRSQVQHEKEKNESVSSESLSA
jgi:CheY-like chemotaxis protein